MNLNQEIEVNQIIQAIQKYFNYFSDCFKRKTNGLDAFENFLPFFVFKEEPKLKQKILKNSENNFNWKENLEILKKDISYLVKNFRKIENYWGEKIFNNQIVINFSELVEARQKKDFLTSFCGQTLFLYDCFLSNKTHQEIIEETKNIYSADSYKLFKKDPAYLDIKIDVTKVMFENFVSYLNKPYDLENNDQIDLNELTRVYKEFDLEKIYEARKPKNQQLTKTI